MANDKLLALIGGTILWEILALMYVNELLASGRPDMGLALAYNLPVFFLFLVVASALAIRLGRLGPSRFVRTHFAALLIWGIGLLVLYLRLVAKTVEISGHLAWLPLLTVQTWVLGLPSWVGAVGVAATLSAAYLKFAVFQGPSGAPGLMVGLVLAGALAITATRPAVEE